MVSTAYENAKGRVTQLKQTISELDQMVKSVRAELERLEHWLADYEILENSELLWVAESKPFVPPKAVRPTLPDREGKVKNPPREVVGNVVADILEHHQRPMSRFELFEALKAEGVVIAGKDPEMVLSTMLWRMQDRFVRLKGGKGYWLRSVPLPGVYDPNEGITVDAGGNSLEDDENLFA